MIFTFSKRILFPYWSVTPLAEIIIKIKRDRLTLRKNQPVPFSWFLD